MTERLSLTISHSVGLKSSLMLQHVSECSSFLRWTNIPLYASATFCISVHLLTDAWVASTFAVVNNAAVNTSIHTLVWIPDVTSRGYIPRSERLLLFFFFLKIHVVHSRGTFKRHKSIYSENSSSHSCHQLLSSNLLISFVGCAFGIWRRQWHPTPVLLPEKSHGRRSPVGCSPWGR